MSKPVPVNWKEYPLRELCEMYQPETISKSSLSRFGKFLVYGANGIIGRYHDYNHEQPEVIMTCRGATCGEVTKTSPFVWITGNAMVITPLNLDLNKDFLRYKLEFADRKKIISGSAQPQITRQDLENLQITIPSISEQERIAEVLLSVDDVIENTQTQINKLSDLKKATMNELLTKGIGHTEFRDSELGPIPKSWRVFSTSNLLNFKNGLNTGKELFGEGVPFLRFVDVMNGIKLTEQSFTVAVRVTEKQRKSFSVMYGDTFFARTSETPDEIGMANTYLGESISAVFNGFCIRGRPKNNDLLPDFSRYLFIAQYVREQMQKLCKFTTRAGITSESLGSCLVAIPDKREQKKISETLSALDNQIKVKEQKLVQLESLKKSLMQDLLTGKVRVKAA